MSIRITSQIPNKADTKPIQQEKKNANSASDAIIANIDSQIDFLTKEKKQIEEEKNKFKATAKEQNLDSSTISSRLKDFDKQITSINSQIEVLKTQKQEEITKKNTPDNDNSNPENNSSSSTSNVPSKDETLSQTNSDKLMNRLIQNSSYVNFSKQFKASLTSITSEKRVLDKEIETDEGRGIDCTKAIQKSIKLSNRINKTQFNLYKTIKKSNFSLEVNQNTNTSKKYINSKNSSDKTTDKDIEYLEYKDKINEYINNIKEKEDEKSNNNALNYIA